MARMASRIVALLGLLLALGPLHAKAPEADDKSGQQSDIDAFLEGLQEPGKAPSKQSPVETPAAPAPTPAPQPTLAAPVASPAVPSVEPVAPGLDAAAPIVPARPQVIGEHLGPVRTLLLMLAGIAVLALATVGLTLAFVALRKDMHHKRRARQRRFIPYPPKKTKPAGQG
jgi:hypothetical protein